MIVPTIGRIVWFYTGKAEDAMPGIVHAVHDNRLVSLNVFDDTGCCVERYVKLVQEGDALPDEGAFCTWMPYQVSAAKKYPA